MKAIDLTTVARFCGGRLASGQGASQVTNITTDSRKVAPGDVFVAIVGERFDAHDFLPQVAAAGAAAVIVSRPPRQPLPCTVIEVTDTLTAIQSLAREYRRWHAPFIVGITGSNGKTSTKDLAARVMARKHQVCATQGNLNNHLGLPLSILQLQEGDTCGVFEMGMNHPGEIAPLAAIAQPDAAIITNIGVAHLENMGSREAIAQEKGELAAAVPSNGLVVLNANDSFSPAIAARCIGRVIQAGLGKGDVAAHELRAGVDGTAFTLTFGSESLEAFLPIPGEHMVGNAALAAALGWQCGIAPADIVAALADVQLTKGRLETKRINGVIFLDDSYNANPDSMKAGLRTLAGLDCSGRRIAVLGRMGELGSHAEAGHREVGAYAAQAGIDAVLSVGDAEASLITQAAGSIGQHFVDHAVCAAHLKTRLRPGDLVLLKGSRSSRMEQVLTHFQTT